ncbi:hypothetical protein KVC_1559 [Ketogulonicigenium vulgare]|nr:hypothetical protein KVC_1559 [Ketogulonicigenium vulgare]
MGVIERTIGGDFVSAADADSTDLANIQCHNGRHSPGTLDHYSEGAARSVKRGMKPA